MTTDHDTTEAAPANADPPIDFTGVARLLADASVLVRTRAERGEHPSRDHRPRIREAIARATKLARPTLEAQADVARDWAVQLAAMEINAALGRGRNRDRGDLREAARTLAGYGLDVGTLGAVNTAADLLAQAAHTAEQIAAAHTMTVTGVGEVTVYQIGPVRADAVELGDLIELNDTVPRPSALPVRGRVRAITTHPDGTRTVHLDLATAGLNADEVTLSARWFPVVWRPVPQLAQPSPHDAARPPTQATLSGRR